MFLGVFNQVKLSTPAGPITVYLRPKFKVSRGDQIQVYVNPEDVKLYSIEEAVED